MLIRRRSRELSVLNRWTRRLRFAASILSLAFASLVVLAAPAQAADGDLDTSFSDDGHRIQNRTKLNDEARSLAFRSDGSVVVGGWDDNNSTLDDAMRIIMEIAAGCGSSGWVYAVMAMHQWQIGMFPPEC